MTELIVDNVYTKVVSLDNKAIDAIREALSYYVQNWEIIQRKTKRWNWDGKASFYDGRSRRFLTGFLDRVEQFLLGKKIKFKRTDVRINPSVELKDGTLHGLTLYDFQVRVRDEFIAKKRGTAWCPTRSGKTEIAISAVKMLDLPTVVFTHRKTIMHNELVKRFKDRLPEMADQIGFVGDSEFNPKRITICMVQTLHGIMLRHKKLKEAKKRKLTIQDIDAQLTIIRKKKKPLQTDLFQIEDLEALRKILENEDQVNSQYKRMADLLASAQFLIIDEAHRSGSSQFNEPASLCVNAYYRLSLTATPGMKDSEEENMYLEGVTGDIVSRITIKELVDRGIVAQPYFEFIRVDRGNLGEMKGWRNVYDAGIINHGYRNGLIVDRAKKLVGMNRSPLIIVHEDRHGKVLQKLLTQDGLKTAYVNGKASHEVRTKYLSELEHKKLDCLICTPIFDEGITVKSLGAAILAGGGKSASMLYQRAGRTMCQKDDGNYSIVVDFIDLHHHLLQEHSASRFSLVKSEAGFKILTKGD